MKLQELYRRIGLPAEAVQRLERAGGEIDWELAGPCLEGLTDPRTASAAFQRRFQILRENLADKEYIQWLFQVPMDTEYPLLPERTSLQRG